MNEGIHLDLDTWIVPDSLIMAQLCRHSMNTVIIIKKIPYFGIAMAHLLFNYI